MLGKRYILTMFTLVVAAAIITLGLKEAQAVPSFARQTGMNCMSCHTVWPELTPFGRTFKLTGYTLSKSGKKYQFPPPIAGLFQASFTHTNRRQPDATAPFNSSANDNVNLPQQASVFYAGKIYDKFGTFMQFTFDGVSNAFFVDNTDFRVANTGKLAGKHLVYGISFNNNPTVQDVWNSTPAWGFPYASSSVAPGPAAATVIDGGLGSQVGGAGLYAYWNNLVYAEVNFYRTAANSYPQFLSAGTHVDSVVDGVAPYWRLYLQHQKGKHTFMLGHYGLVSNIFPGGQTRGSSDHFTDIAFDAQYQYITHKHKFSIEATWIHEIQDWSASFALGDTGARYNNLDTARFNINYFYWSKYGTIGGTVAYFNTFGGRDRVLYAPDPVGGSRNGLPNSSGVILQAEYLPPIWERRTKIVVQYTIYNQFNGASSNYDGFGRSAGDNNTLYVLIWQMF
ncbi:MAG: cytochrome C [Deltaproteobacteria bacterium]|jgi:hypothetical protein